MTDTPALDPGKPHGRTKDLQHRFLGAVAMTAVSRGVLAVASIGVTFVMARLLLPEDYGLMAMATVVTGLLSMFQAVGVGTALVQREEVTAENEQTAFSLAFFASSALCAIIFLIAHPVALLYDDPRVTPLLRVLGLTFPISAFSVVPASMLRREMRMRGDAVTNVLSTIAESVTMLVLAWRGFGTWSLVAGQLVASLTLAVGLSIYHPWSIGFRLRGGDIRSIARFGGGATMSGFFWYAYQNADFFIIGRVLGPSALGAYSMAWKVAKMPWERLWQAVTPVLLPLYSRARSEPGELAAILCRLTRFTALVTVPAIAGLGSVADDVVALFLGPEWHLAAAPLAWLSAYMAVRSILALLPFILMAVGRIGQEVAFNAGCAVVLPLSFVIAVNWGIVGVAVAWVVVWPMMAAFWLVPRALAAAQLPLRQYLASMFRPVLATAAMVLAVWAVGLAVPAPLPVRLAVRVGTGVLVYLACIRVLEGPLVPEFKRVLQGIREGVKR